MADGTRAAHEAKKIDESLRTLKEGNEANAKEIGEIKQSLRDLGEIRESLKGLGTLKN